jgi:hypothetical protein
VVATLFRDAPIAGSRYDTLGRLPVARRLVELVTRTADEPLVLAIVGSGGAGKTSALRMAGELCAERGDVRAFAIDAWTAGDTARVNDEMLRELSRIFGEERVVGQTEKVRERLFAVGDVVSAVARFAGAKVDVKGALEKSADKLREQVLEYTQEIGKRFVIVIDHIDLLPAADAVAALKLAARWGAFPYFAIVLAFDRQHLARKLAAFDGNVDDLDRIVDVELPLPPPDPAVIAACVRGGLVAIASELKLDPGAALALFDVDGGVGLPVLDTLRAAKRYTNTLVSVMPLAPPWLDLRNACLLELIRIVAPAALPRLFDQLRLGRPVSALAADLPPYATSAPRPDVALALFAAL